MPRNPMDFAREWLVVAETDLLAARNLIGNPALPRQASYCAQQAAEKAIKALLAADNIPFPKTHDLVELVALVPAQSPLHGMQIDWATLTEWAVRGRYPGTGSAAMAVEAAAAITMAERIVNCVQLTVVTR